MLILSNETRRVVRLVELVKLRPAEPLGHSQIAPLKPVIWARQSGQL